MLTGSRRAGRGDVCTVGRALAQPRAGNWQCLRDEREQKMAFPELCLCPYMCWPRARVETLSS